jgi:glycosyltransferase involved in cell wall biosynthesis
MPKNPPKISICIPTYNGEDYLNDALDSINAQSFRDFEVVASDDASTDNTLKILEDFKSKADFPVYIYKHQPKGIGANWNNTIKHANGEFIKFLFQDDVLLPDCLEKMHSAFDNFKNIGLVACKRIFIINLDEVDDEQEKWLKTYQDLQQQFNQSNQDIMLTKSIFKRSDFKSSPLNKIGEPSVVMFRKSIVKKVGLFDLRLKQILDYVYWYKILKYKPILILNEPLVKFRIHRNQETQKNKHKSIKDYVLYDKILYKNFFWLLNFNTKKKYFLKYNIFGKILLKLKKSVF